MMLHQGKACRQCNLDSPACGKKIRWDWREVTVDSLCVAFSTRGKQIMVNHGLENVYLIPHGIDVDFWHPLENRPETPKLKCFASSAWGLIEWKGLDIFYDVLDEFKGEVDYYAVQGGAPHDGAEKPPSRVRTPVRGYATYAFTSIYAERRAFLAGLLAGLTAK